MSSAITFHNVSFSINKKPILKDISFSINEGRITGILGANGAGKTSLLSLMNGLHKHSSGSITILGNKLPAGSLVIRQRTGVVLQETALYEELTTYENLLFAASLYNVNNPKERILEVLDLLKLTPRATQIVSTLSGGLRRRVAIARALLHDPDLLIIDEPTLGVDSDTRHTVWSYLKLLKKKGRTIVIASNYHDEVEAVCDHIMELSKGTLV